MPQSTSMSGACKNIARFLMKERPHKFSAKALSEILNIEPDETSDSADWLWKNYQTVSCYVVQRGGKSVITYCIERSSDKYIDRGTYYERMV